MIRDRRSRRLYRWLLRMLPGRLTARHGREMEAMFGAELEAAAAQGPLGVLSLWLHSAADLAFAWPRELAHRVRRRDRVGLPAEGRPIMLLSDVRYGLRSLARQKTAATLVVAMLALGIAANVAVFSLANGLFFRPFPFDEPERLVYVNEKAPKWNLEFAGISFPDFDTWRKSQHAFESLAVWMTQSMNLSDGANADRILAAAVSHEFADVLRVQPALGRAFTADDDKPGASPVTLLGDSLWRDRFAGDPNVLGKTLKLSGEAYTIIGVLPAIADAFPGRARLWVPLKGDPTRPGRSYGPEEGLGRLKSGLTAGDAERDLLRAHQPIFETRDKERVVSPVVHPLREISVREFRSAAATLGGAVALLLLVACANVAAVMLARALSRRREMGIRVAVGANRLRLVRQLFVENLLLAAIGGLLGLALGQWAIRWLVQSIPDGAPPWASFGIDTRVMLFALATSILTVLVFGWAPALHAVRGDLRSAMHNTANAAASTPGGRRTLRVIIGVEFALATLLIVGGGLLLRAYQRVHSVDPGFTATGVLQFTVSLPAAVYPDAAKRLAFWERVETRVAQLPGVTSAGLVNCPPFGCHWGSFFIAEGQPPRTAVEGTPVVLNRVATPAYFPTLGIRLKSGRFFEPQDRTSEPARERVIIVNETFARTFFPTVSNPVGLRVRKEGNDQPWMRIVGLVEDVRHYGLEVPMRPGIYWPMGPEVSSTMAVVLKTDGDPEALAGLARAAMRELDPELPLFNVRSMESALAQTMAVRRTYSWMLVVFALTALALAIGGTYGVSSYLVTQRTKEFGIRVALGAGRRDIVRGVLRASLAMAATGIAIGVVASLGLSRLLASLLFGVKPNDVGILASAVAVLAAAAVVANLLPARRAARVDPMTSLRAE